MLRKFVYPYEYMDSLERFDKTSLPKKVDFYSNLNMEDITNADYKNPKRVWKDFKTKNLSEYQDLHLQSDTLLPAYVFKNFWKTCIEIYKLDLAHFFSAPGLVWQTCLKKTEVKLQLLTDIDMFLMVEKWIREEICHALYRDGKSNKKYMKE